MLEYVGMDSISVRTLTALVEIPNFFCTSQKRLQNEQSISILLRNGEDLLNSEPLRDNANYEEQGKLECRVCDDA